MAATNSMYDSDHNEKWNEWIDDPWAGLPIFKQAHQQDLHEDSSFISDDEGSSPIKPLFGSDDHSVSPLNASNGCHLSDLGSDSDVPAPFDHESDTDFIQPPGENLFV